jgi:EpsI family protein
MKVTRLWLLAVMFAAAAYARVEVRTTDVPERPRTLKSFPAIVDQWQGVEGPRFDDRVLALLGADEYINRVYRSHAGGVGLYVGYYRSQVQGDSIHSPLNCLPGAGWEPVEKSRVTLRIPNDQRRSLSGTFQVNQLTVQKGEDKQLVLYWYQTRGRVVASEYWNKWYLVADAFGSGRTDAALVRIINPIDRNSDGAGAAAQAAGFATAVLPIVNLWLFE